MNIKCIFKTPSDRERLFRGGTPVMSAASSARKATQSVGFVLIAFKWIFKKRSQDREIPLLCIIIAKNIVLFFDISIKIVVFRNLRVHSEDFFIPLLPKLPK